jgi:hypothetical protein
MPWKRHFQLLAPVYLNGIKAPVQVWELIGRKG